MEVIVLENEMRIANILQTLRLVFSHITAVDKISKAD